MSSTRLPLLIALAAVMAIPSAKAVDRTWPGAAPCNASLQACINASAAGDTVLVAQHTVIDETVLINKPLALRAAIGYRPTLAAGRVIAGTVSAVGNWSWQVEGFDLLQGFISINVSGGDFADIRISRNRVREALSGAAEISVFKPSDISTTLRYEISDNDVSYFWDSFDGALRAGIQVLDGGVGSSSGRIRENRVRATGQWSIGILVSTQDRNHRTEVLGNRVQGGRSGSILLRQGSLVGPTAGTLTAIVLNNVVNSVIAGSQFADGIKVDAYDGVLNLIALHNTVTDASNGIDVYADPAVTAAGEIGANLFAYTGSFGLQRFGAATSIGDRDNLFFLTSETAATPGLSTSSVFADPLLRHPPQDAHLRSGSPAIDRLTSTALLELLLADNLPLTDGDGLRRFKRANTGAGPQMLDIGALEAGDSTLLHAVPVATAGISSQLDDPVLNNIADAYPHNVGNWNPDGGPGVYNDHPVSLGYNGSRWYLRQEDLASYSSGARFNVFAPGFGSGRYLHQNTAGNTSGAFTTLNHPDLNNRPDYILLVTRNPGSGTVIDLNAPIAVNYFSGAWSVYRMTGTAMPNLGGFNVYFQPPSSNAFRHRTGVGNTGGNVSLIDHPLLNDHRCAKFHVSQATDLVVSNPHQIGVYYSPSAQRWSLFNQDLATMPLGAEFHIVVDPQSVDCAGTLFANGFE
jgi:hypothetical protein